MGLSGPVSLAAPRSIGSFPYMPSIEPTPTAPETHPTTDPGLAQSLQTLEAKLARGERLTAEDGLFLYQKAPLPWLQRQADAVRLARHGQEAYFNRNIHFEPTNKCVYACKFCAFYRPPKATEADGAWDYGFEDLK